MAQIFANNAFTQLAAGISSSATTILLTTGTGALFPNPGAGQFFTLTLNDALTKQIYEICYCTARTGDSCTVTRGQEGTTARSWLLGDYAYNAWTANALLPIGYQNIAVYTNVSGVQYVAINGGSPTTSGATSFPAPATQQAFAKVWGGGGGGGGVNGTAQSSGGSPGGYCEATFTGLTSATTVTVGAAGAGGNGTPTNGGTGGNSSFGSMTANGGGGGFASSSGGQSTVGSPGSATGGSINLSGNGGSGSISGGGGSGGNAPGGGGPGGAVGSINGTGAAGSTPGGGGGGTASTSGGQSGGAGGAGMVVVYY
jgi:hypothetical protein